MTRWTAGGAGSSPCCLDDRWVVTQVTRPGPYRVVDRRPTEPGPDVSAIERWTMAAACTDLLELVDGPRVAAHCERHNIDGPWCGPCLREQADDAATAEVSTLCRLLDDAANRAVMAVLR